MAFYLTPQLQFELDEMVDLRASVASRLGLSRDAVVDFKIFRKSLDVRHKHPRYVMTLMVDVGRDVGAIRALERKKCVLAGPRVTLPALDVSGKGRVCIIGAGPSGLFAALTLAHYGVAADIYERGRDVKARTRDVAALMNRAVLDPESNICFGEGGAGTFSDGKLMTRTKSQFIPVILERFVKFGAESSILYEAHPHIGTDRLAPILREMRAWLESQHVSYHFETRVEDLWIENGRCRGICVCGERIGYDAVFMCIGHSADDMFECLARRGVAMASKPLAVGFRVEHPQALIDSIQYGRYARHAQLPPAEYAVRFNHETLPSVFSFCMCPGGTVVPSQTTADCRVVNGMSGSHRNGKYANAALVVQVGPEDFGAGALDGLKWVRALERKAAEGCAPGIAPAQAMLDFLNDRVTSGKIKTTYSPGVQSADLRRLLPAKLSDAMCAALPVFDQQMRGFVTAEAKFIGVESRTSSPVRILRDEHFQAVDIAGLYPVGEGAGYAGGITSCALDGLNAALSYIGG